MGSKFYLQSNSTSATSLAQLDQTRSPSPRANSIYSHTQSPPTTPHRHRRIPAPLSLASAITGDDYDDSDNDHDEDEDDTTSLPFPVPLPRADFLQPEPFDPPSYLSSVVTHRYQTLEDLRDELRSRVQMLSNELVELVNRHQDEFLGLGTSLKGGDEKVEEVRVGVLGLEREFTEMKRQVDARATEVKMHLDRRKAQRRAIDFGKACLEVEEEIGSLERRMLVRDADSESGESDDDEEDEEEGDKVTISLKRLERRAEDMLGVEKMADRVGREVPFIISLTPRIRKCSETLLMDIGNYVRQAKDSDALDSDRKLRVLNLYASLDASADAVSVMKRK